MQARLDQLDSVVEQQKIIISKLASELKFVLSFLDIQHDDSSAPIGAAADSIADHSNGNAVKSFADVVKQSVMSVSKDFVNHDNQDAVAAMYAEQAQKLDLLIVLSSLACLSMLIGWILNLWNRFVPRN
jgi:hypothetical protein